MLWDCWRGRLSLGVGSMELLGSSHDIACNRDALRGREVEAAEVLWYRANEAPVEQLKPGSSCKLCDCIAGKYSI